MSCIITISGDQACLRKFLRKHKHIEGVLHCKSADRSCWVGIRISNAGFNQLDEEIQDAISFLRSREGSLGALARDPGIEDAYISFAAEKTPDIASFAFLPRELVALCGRCGLAIRMCYFRIARSPRSPEKR